VEEGGEIMKGGRKKRKKGRRGKEGRCVSRRVRVEGEEPHKKRGVKAAAFRVRTKNSRRF